jgi:pyrroline-5-carboxylate reductase
MMDQALAPVIDSLGDSEFDRKLIISIAAGITLDRLESRLYPPLSGERQRQMPIVRVMPNTPALVLSGMAGMSANRHAQDDDTTAARTILEAMGGVRVFPEASLDAVTALSGSGPAYVFYFIEAMTRGGIALGLDPEAAAELTRATFMGALKLLIETGEDPAELRQKVTSPGGTTEAALKVFAKSALDQIIVDAMAAAAHRSKELSG